MITTPKSEEIELSEDWYTYQSNVAVLIGYLCDIRADYDEISYAAEKPWKFADRYKEALEAGAGVE